LRDDPMRVAKCDQTETNNGKEDLRD
jgi:hypothetical protein